MFMIARLNRTIGGQLPGKQMLKTLISATLFPAFSSFSFFFVLTGCHSNCWLAANVYMHCFLYFPRYLHHPLTCLFLSPQLRPQSESLLPLAFCERATHSASSALSLETHCKCGQKLSLPSGEQNAFYMYWHEIPVNILFFIYLCVLKMQATPHVFLVYIGVKCLPCGVEEDVPLGEKPLDLQHNCQPY